MNNELNELKIEEIMFAIERELRSAATKHAPLNSFHEGYAVLLEEVDELKEEVWKKSSLRDHDNMRTEAKQVAAMAARFLYDLL